MEVTYSSTRCDQWRCNLYVMFHRPQTVFSQLLIVAVFSFWLVPLLRSSGLHAIWALPGGVLASVVFYGSLQAFLLHMMILKRLPMPNSQRICTTLILPELFRDITPNKTMEHRWTQITDIRLHQNDFYFWLGGTQGNFIPRGAFENSREAQRFFETAVYYWQCAKSGQVATGMPSQSGVWPPAPRPGA